MKRIKLQEGRRLQEGYLTDEGARTFRLDYPDGYTYKGVTIQYSRLGVYSVYDERSSKRVTGDPRVAMVYDGRNYLGFGVNWSSSGSWNATLKDTQVFTQALQEAMDIAEHLNKIVQKYER